MKPSIILTYNNNNMQPTDAYNLDFIQRIDAGEQILYGTTEYWNSQNNLIGKEGAIYIYSDYKVIGSDDTKKLIPGIKIGDGKAYLLDVPFITETEQEILFQHMSDSEIHTNSTEKNFWNKKITSYISNNDPENLILSNT